MRILGIKKSSSLYTCGYSGWDLQYYKNITILVGGGGGNRAPREVIAVLTVSNALASVNRDGI